MTGILDTLAEVLIRNGLVTAFTFVGLTVWISYFISGRLTGGRIHGSAIAILLGLIMAYAGGVVTGGSQGLADIEILAGVGLLGGAMIRDFAIIATAFGVSIDEIRKAGTGAVLSLFAGVFVSFFVGAAIA
ncbi:MAG: malonate transporter subunit MadM, partial [Gemmatimonadota bacterium]